MKYNRKDEALAPVIAFFLLLAIIVSFIALLNAYYIPSLKQQEEVRHLQSVEEVFCLITGDISKMALFQKDVSLQERIQLGGGAVLLSPLTSSGTLQLQQSEIFTLIIEDENNLQTKIPITTVNISYQPIGNFWVDQGYIWERGLVYITKPSKRTWLEYTTAEDAQKAEEVFLKSVFIPQTLTNSSMSVYTLTADPTSSFRSGNGISGINMFMTRKEQVIHDVVNVELDLGEFDNELLSAWRKPSFEGPTSLTVEVYEIMVKIV